MSSDFRKTFKPSSDDIDKQNIALLKAYIELICRHDCSVCKNSLLVHCRDHGHESSNYVCNLSGKIHAVSETCLKYSAKSFNELLDIPAEAIR